ncbi:hypothetical protein BC830DRAFT_1129725 [Chytriomyces sp. MP71]|nr:hypothetical protein BC830DRAFT_1129725 [Chytriomyces sp. MP71]
MFRASSALCFPRYPRFSGPTITRHAPPSKEMIDAIKTQPKAPKPAAQAPSVSAPAASIPSNPSNLKHHLTSTQTAVPLPTTFASPSDSIASHRAAHALNKIGQPLFEPAPLPASAGSAYPYRYYKITLRRGLRGIDADTRKCVLSLGLHGRHEVVWRPVCPQTAGLVLKVRELVTVELANELPQETRRPRAVKGYNKIGNSVLDNLTV